MNIPERLWGVVKGRWSSAMDSWPDQTVEARLAEAAAYEELAAALRPSAPPVPASPPASARSEASYTPVRGGSPPAPAPRAEGGYDPLAASYALVGVEPGASMSEVETAYERGLGAIRPEQYAAGTPERRALEGRRSALNAAYERLRDALNPTETRFERLEF